MSTDFHKTHFFFLFLSPVFTASLKGSLLTPLLEATKFNDWMLTHYNVEQNIGKDNL